MVTRDKVLRYLRAGAQSQLDELADSTAGGKLLASGDLLAWQGAEDVGGMVLDGEDFEAVIAHRRIEFASYPHEWPVEMLAAAGRCTLAIAKNLLADGFGLKDATPYNVLFDGPRPILVDVLSIERRRAGDPLWLAEAQFLRCFVLPLLACRTLGRPTAEAFLADRDGLEPETLYRSAGPLRRFAPGFFGLVTLPVWLAGMANRRGEGLYRAGRAGGHVQRAAFVMGHRL
ncbi:MAG: SAM-dependent methyltransferase, partial [Verrucomicrobiota bacterium]|nr:SAM-dependent methyltransferase [Verrucomicrobiota bacterium]